MSQIRAQDPATTQAELTSPNIFQPRLPTDQNLRAVADDVLAQLRYSYAVAASTSGRGSAPGELDKLFTRFLATRRTAAREQVAKAASGHLQSAEAPRTFGRYAAISPAAYRTIGSDGIGNHVAALSVDGHQLHPALTQIANTIGDSQTPHNTVPAPQPGPPPSGGVPAGFHIKDRHSDPAGLAYKKLRLNLRRVTCIRQTSGALEFADEISMGGTFTVPSGATTTMIDEFVVGTGFVSHGPSKEFGNSKVLATWDLPTAFATGYPHVYSAVIALTEKDGGGFYDFLMDLWSKVRAMVVAAISTFAGAAIGAALGSVFGPVGTVIGAVVGAFIDWIVGLFKNEDDILGAKPVMVALGTAKKAEYDNAGLTSANGSWQGFSLDLDGLYSVGVSFGVFTS